ncbi:predicted protein [Histoplasma capsulatum var. duboisii H88]|uniref:Predicted protein n=1 Tax=Ajellomyces capsulatus (strain H88) TaxID=544711 RepID=F0ULE3_AJEC8|nr:predicted protein [Histoplasma capsulatum var. duboisii H88]
MLRNGSVVEPRGRFKKTHEAAICVSARGSQEKERAPSEQASRCSTGRKRIFIEFHSKNTKEEIKSERVKTMVPNESPAVNTSKTVAANSRMAIAFSISLLLLILLWLKRMDLAVVRASGHRKGSCEIEQSEGRSPWPPRSTRRLNVTRFYSKTGEQRGASKVTTPVSVEIGASGHSQSWMMMPRYTRCGDFKWHITINEKAGANDCGAPFSKDLGERALCSASFEVVNLHQDTIPTHTSSTFLRFFFRNAAKLGARHFHSLKPVTCIVVVLDRLGLEDTF